MCWSLPAQRTFISPSDRRWDSLESLLSGLAKNEMSHGCKHHKSSALGRSEVYAGYCTCAPFKPIGEMAALGCLWFKRTRLVMRGADFMWLSYMPNHVATVSEHRERCENAACKSRPAPLPKRRDSHDSYRNWQRRGLGARITGKKICSPFTIGLCRWGL